jgi:hypothetical protein
MPVTWRTVDPSLLNPQFRQDIQAVLEYSPHWWTVTHGFRSLAEQNALWLAYQAGGPKAAPPGKSAHNYGLAVDVALDGSPAPGLQPDWDTSHAGWIWLFDAVFRHPRLHSGRSFSDSDHVERLGWKSFR